MAKKISPKVEMILEVWEGLQQEYPFLSQVTDMWMDLTKRGYDQPLFVAYRGLIYTVDLGWTLYNYKTLNTTWDSLANRRVTQTPEDKRNKVLYQLQVKLMDLVKQIRKDEQENRFDRRRLGNLYPGLAR